MIKNKNTSFKHILIGLISLLLPFQFFAQEVGSWWMYYGLNRIHNNWSIWTEAQYRSHDHGQNIEQLLLRTALNYHLSKNSLFALGYGYVATYELETDIKSPTTEEGRIFEQYIHKHIIPHIQFEHRLRLEQRWLQGIYLNRIRYRLFLSVPINKKYMELDTWFIGIYDEIFLNTIEEYFDRNRLYLALGYQIDEYINIQSGMMNQFTKNGDKWYFQLALTWNTDFRK